MNKVKLLFRFKKLGRRYKSAKIQYRFISISAYKKSGLLVWEYDETLIGYKRVNSQHIWPINRL